MKKQVLETSQKLLEAHFQKHEPKMAELETFMPKDNATLKPLFRPGGVRIPIDPHDNKLSMLLSDLKNDGCKNSKVYAHLQKASEGTTPAALYATSGGGKTRSLFEYLSHNKGLYFVAGDHSRNAGSRDMDYIFLQMHFLTVAAGTYEGKKQSQDNLALIYFRVGVMIVVRLMVHDIIEGRLARKITPYEWLLYQLYPTQLLGGDVYADVLYNVIVDDDVDKISVYKAFKTVIGKTNGKDLWHLSCIDDAQELLKHDESLFLSNDGTQTRSAFYALLHAFSDVNVQFRRGCPVFSGTNLSFDDSMQQSRSIVGERVTGEFWPPVFVKFVPLNEGKVKEYIQKFLDVKDIRDEVLTHVAKWLVGRPRWVASFLEVYLYQKKRSLNHEGGTRGAFNHSEGLLMEALDRYLLVMTSNDSDWVCRNISWAAGETSAFAAIRRVMKKPSSPAMDDLKLELRNAVYDFAVGKKPTFLTSETKELIQDGVAQIFSESAAGSNVDVALNEPIIVQAGINFFALKKFPSNYLEIKKIGDQEHAFEKVMLPALQDKDRLASILEKQLSNEHELKGYSVSRLSSYGVLAASCKDVHDTLKWIETAILAKFEGMVPPFCYPDEHFGPDVMFLLWNSSYTDFRTCICQAKFRKSVDHLEVLRTLVPDWLYHEDRKHPEKRKVSPILRDSMAEIKWNNIKEKLVGDERPCLRLLVQYPSHAAYASEPGRVDSNVLSPKYMKSSKRQKIGRDYLATIQGRNGGELFGDATKDALDYLKRRLAK